MADNSVFIAGAASGAFAEAMEGLPPWATQKTAEDIESLLRKSLGIQTKVLSQLVKNGTGGKSADPTDLNNELDKLLKNARAQNAEAPKAKKRHKEEEEEFKKKKKGWAEEKEKTKGRLLYEGLAIKAGNALWGTMVENVNTFDQLYKAGIDMVSGFDSASNGFEALQQMAALTGVRYTELAQTMMKYSQAVNSFGAAKFAKTMTMASGELAKFGFNTKESADLLGTYLETQRGFADVNSKTQDEVQKDLVKFGERITKVSTATGMMRTKLLENLDAISKSVEATILSGQIGTDASEKTQEFIASFSDKNVGTAFLRMMTDSIKPLNATFMDFQKIGFGGFGQKLMEFTRSLEGLDPEEAQKRTAEFTKANKVEMDRMTQQANLLRQVGSKEADGALTMIAGLQQQARAYKEVNAADRAKMEATSKATKDLQSAWEKFQAQLQITFAPTHEILDLLTRTLGILSGFTKWIRDGVTSLETFINSFESVNKMFGKIDLAPWIAVGVIGLGLYYKFNMLQKAVGGLGSVLAWVTKKALGVKDKSASSAGSRTSGNTSRGNRGGKADPGILGTLGSGIGAILEGLAKGIGAFANPKILLGASILAGSIAVIGAGIAGATWIIGKALPSFAEGLKAFDGINGGNLIEVAKGVGALGLAMAAFGVGSVAASFGSVIGTIAGGFSKLFGDGSMLDQLKAFGAVGPGLQAAVSSINNISSSLSNLSATLGAFKGIDNLKAIVSTINSIDLLKAVAFAALGARSGVSLPAPTTPVGVSVPTSPKASTLNSPSAVSPAEDKGTQVKALDPGSPSKPGIEKARPDTGINSMLSYQSSLLEQLLTSTNNLVSVNKDILKYTKVRS
jgi:hypothetical protein